MDPVRFALASLAVLVACCSAAWGAAGPAAGVVTPVTASLRYDFEYPIVGYSGPARHNAIARLQERLDRGEVTLEYHGARGYLDSVLEALGIDPSSQVLVYSKTSLQIDHINAATPRAIYFNDDSYVAWVQGSNVLELSVMDAELGAVFYTLTNEPGPVKMDRETSRCLTCHDTYSMMGGGVPRFLINSTVVDTNGIALWDESSHETNDTTPLEERWGGWYVTGVPDGERHLGNLLIPSSYRVADAHGRERGTLHSLRGLVDTAPYPTGNSDLVALLVLEHQLFIKNQITRLSFKARTFLARDGAARAPAPVSFADASPQTQAVVHTMCEQLLRGMLFVDAVSYRTPLAGTSGYDRWFQAHGVRDSKGRSLRDLDLRTRLFKYPLSYVVYSEAFDALPLYVRQYLYGRLRDILQGTDRSATYARLSAADRAAVLEILTATKPDFRRLAPTQS
jgi:hypothetical protein